MKYLGLLALGNIMPIAPKIISGEYKDIVIHCLNDEDISIRLRALDLIVGMVNLLFYLLNNYCMITVLKIIIIIIIIQIIILKI